MDAVIYLLGTALLLLADLSSRVSCYSLFNLDGKTYLNGEYEVLTTDRHIVGTPDDFLSGIIIIKHLSPEEKVLLKKAQDEFQVYLEKNQKELEESFKKQSVAHEKHITELNERLKNNKIEMDKNMAKLEAQFKQNKFF